MLYGANHLYLGYPHPAILEGSLESLYRGARYVPCSLALLSGFIVNRKRWTKRDKEPFFKKLSFKILSYKEIDIFHSFSVIVVLRWNLVEKMCSDVTLMAAIWNS